MSVIGIKFSEGGAIYNVNTDLQLEISDKVVVETTRGIEVGSVCASAPNSSESEIKSVLRKITDKDEKKLKELKRQEKDVEQITNELIAKYNLNMKVVSVSYTLDGAKVIISYVCEDRVDFRELVKELASKLRVRIELRQIGIRDQAKILGGIGFCGKECCCKKYLNDFDKVSIKMAKTQGLSLNPSKISGICGRLMCCLSYENDMYAEIVTQMPKMNAKVKTRDGMGTVIYNNILKQMVTVRIENDGDTRVQEYPLGEIEIIARTNEIIQDKKPDSKKFGKDSSNAKKEVKSNNFVNQNKQSSDPNTKNAFKKKRKFNDKNDRNDNKR